MEAESESLYRAIEYAKGEALEPFTKEVFTVFYAVGEGTNTGMDYWTDIFLVLCIFWLVH